MQEKKPTSRAIALLYDREEGGAPKVVASGKGVVAEKIIAAAREAGIHIQQDEHLVELLAKVDIGNEIPLDLYQTVAEVLAFVYRINEKFKTKMR